MEIEPSDIGEDEYISQYKSTPEHKTRILPLRWFANFCNVYPASWALHRALYHEDKASYFNTKLAKRGYMWWRLYKIFNAPYDRWGTTYILEI